jgi:hypothetical protein
MFDSPLDVCDPPAGIALVPSAVEVLGYGAELHDEVSGEVFRPGFAPLLAPEADKGGLIASHDDPGVGAPDEGTAILIWFCLQRRAHRPSPFWVAGSKVQKARGSSGRWM